MAYDRDLMFVYMNTTKTIFGDNTAKSISSEIDELGGSKVLLVTDATLREAGLVERLEQWIGGKLVGTFDKCCPDSAVTLVNEGAAFAKDLGVDCVVSLGGGSVIDTAKCISIILKEGGELADYSGLQNLNRPITPHIAIPTTSGTGSEVTWAAVIKDWDAGRKLIFGDYFIIPRVAILDPILVSGMPPMLTATTGMDAFCHAVEAVHSMQCEPMTDGMAMHAIRLLMQYMPLAVENGQDLVARGQQMIAATMAGVAFGNAMIGLVHAMAHSIGALAGIPHGMANSILLPHCMVYNMDTVPDRYKLIAEAMGLFEPGMSDEEAGMAAVNGIWDLTKKMGVPQKLSEVGATEEHLAAAASLSLSDGSIVYNPKPVFEEEEVLSVFKKAF